jgi:hypothetical protein
MDFETAINELLHEVEIAAERTLEKAGQLGITEARSTTLFKHGNAFDEGIVFHKLSGHEGEVVSEKDIYLEYGNGPKGSEIPFNHPHVAFIEAIQDFRYVTHTVAHGPLPYMTNASEAVDNAIEDIFEAEFADILR